MFEKMKIFSGNANPDLAIKIAKALDLPLGECEIKSFSDGEISVDIKESVRGMDIYVIQSICTPTNDNLMELLIMLDALKRASANSITAVIPYYGYARQDRKVAPRVPISAKLVADLVTVAGATRVLCLDLHAGQIQGFFNIPVDNLYAASVVLEHIRNNYSKDIVVVSPDAGGVERARAFAKRLDADLAIVDKRRAKANESEVMNVIGDVDGRDVVLLDDMIDTAGTITHAAAALKDRGAKNVYACCTHGVFSGPAIERLEDSVITEIVATDSIPSDRNTKSNKIKYLSVGPLIGEAIKRIHYGGSVSSLFE